MTHERLDPAEDQGFTVLNSETVRVNGHHERHTWLKGHYPDLGAELVQGWTGPETFVRKTVIKPIVIFEVK